MREVTQGLVPLRLAAQRAGATGDCLAFHALDR
jgi:hypothetical protein